MSLIPSLDDLIRQLNQAWHLSWTENDGVSVILIEAYESVAMNMRYQCYSAIFAQSKGMQLPQYTYRLQSPEGCAWDVLLTPVGPDEEGDKQLLQAVFHIKRHQAVGI